MAELVQAARYTLHAALVGIGNLARLNSVQFEHVVHSCLRDLVVIVSRNTPALRENVTSLLPLKSNY